jgi:hypothetical protein
MLLPMPSHGLADFQVNRKLHQSKPMIIPVEMTLIWHPALTQSSVGVKQTQFEVFLEQQNRIFRDLSIQLMQMIISTWQPRPGRQGCSGYCRDRETKWRYHR